VYVSGTAAIDPSGATVHVGDAAGQIAVTVENVRAVFRDMGCGDSDVVQAIVYSKTPEVERVFLQQYGKLGWPLVSVIADVCRDDLLFEVEAMGCPGAKKV
jgi:enamine deaminase RidA (YjgF/YER057c/UK114 family)